MIAGGQIEYIPKFPHTLSLVLIIIIQYIILSSTVMYLLTNPANILF